MIHSHSHERGIVWCIFVNTLAPITLYVGAKLHFYTLALVVVACVMVGGVVVVMVVMVVMVMVVVVMVVMVVDAVQVNGMRNMHDYHPSL